MCSDFSLFLDRIKQEGVGKFLKFSGAIVEILEEVELLTDMSDGVLFARGNFPLIFLSELVDVLKITRDSNVGFYSTFDGKCQAGFAEVFVWVSIAE